MELDDLKKTWKQEQLPPTKTTAIMEMIQQKSRGPLASLKQSFRRQMIAIAALMTCVTVANGKYLESIPGYVLYFSYIAFCMAMIVAFYVNYRRTSNMENMDKAVKNNLEDYVVQLENRLKWQYMGSRIVILLFIVLLEVLPLFYPARMLDKWHSADPVIRFSAYAVYFLLVYFISKRVKKQKFGQHLDHLKSLLDTMK